MAACPSLSAARTCKHAHVTSQADTCVGGTVGQFGLLLSVRIHKKQTLPGTCITTKTYLFIYIECFLLASKLQALKTDDSHLQSCLTVELHFPPCFYMSYYNIYWSQVPSWYCKELPLQGIYNKSNNFYRHIWFVTLGPQYLAAS